MEKIAAVGITMFMLLAGNYVQAGMCEIVNGSFEADGPINNITVTEPNAWDVNVSADKFGGDVSAWWRTDGSFSLGIWTQWFKRFEPGQTATVSQQVYLADANQIIFDLKLETDWLVWDPALCSAVMLIDDEVVWESNSVGPDVRGVYLDQVYTVEDRYRDEQMHKLSLGIRVNTAEMLEDFYITRWDSIMCTSFCEGGGLLVGDINRDCYVNVEDLKLIADSWLDEVEPDYECNLFQGDDFLGYGAINLFDFAVFAGNWDVDIVDLGEFAEKWLSIVPINDEHNLSHNDDVIPNGFINFLDFAVFSGDWMANSYPPEE